MFGLNWRKRAIEAEKQLANLTNQTTLLSIHRDGRKNVFTFQKNGDIHRISTMGTWSDDIDQWSELLCK